ncbi:MAG: lysostaphin resistance A-like protein [Ignavibacteria bacterium]
MANRFTLLIVLILIAFLFWVEMFVLKHFNFWIEMLAASSLLACISLYINRIRGREINFNLFYFENKFILIGIMSAVILYGIFFVGNELSSVLFSFADNQVKGIYENKILLNPSIIGLLLFFIIGPAEEIFWRGFVQYALADKFGGNAGWITASFIYGGVHLVAMNFMLFIAALICGTFWGYIFKRYKSLWPGIISHAVWDLTIFVILPVR